MGQMFVATIYLGVSVPKLLTSSSDFIQVKISLKVRYFFEYQFATYCLISSRILRYPNVAYDALKLFFNTRQNASIALPSCQVKLRRSYQQSTFQPQLHRFLQQPQREDLPTYRV